MAGPQGQGGGLSVALLRVLSPCLVPGEANNLGESELHGAVCRKGGMELGVPPVGARTIPQAIKRAAWRRDLWERALEEEEKGILV